jgi:hypothetical protein
MVTKGKQVNICRCGQSPTTPAKTDFKWNINLVSLFVYLTRLLTLKEFSGWSNQGALIGQGMRNYVVEEKCITDISVETWRKATNSKNKVWMEG